MCCMFVDFNFLVWFVSSMLLVVIVKFCKLLLLLIFVFIILMIVVRFEWISGFLLVS